MFKTLVISALMFFFWACPAAADNSWDLIQAKGRLVVGFDGGYPPLAFYDDQGRPAGFEADLAVEFARRLGLEVQWLEMPRQALIHALYARKIDCVVSALPMTKTNKMQVAFSNPYIEDGLVLAVGPHNADIQKPGDIKGKTVALVKGTKAEDFLKTADKKPGKTRQYPDLAQAVQALANGDVDAVIALRLPLLRLAGQSEHKFAVLPDLLTKTTYGAAFRRDDSSLKSRIQRTLNQMLTDGAMSAISQRWFATDLYPQEPKPDPGPDPENQTQ